MRRVGAAGRKTVSMFGKLVAIAGNTLRETVRQPIYAVLMWVMGFWVALTPAVAGFTLGNREGDTKMVQDIGLTTLLLYGLLASVFGAAGAISREIESHTVLTVVSKPVSRPVFLLGKYLGVGGAVSLGYYFLCLVLFLATRHGVLSTASDKPDQPVLLFGALALLISLLAAAFGNFVYGWYFPTALMAWVVPLGTLALVGVLFFSRTWQFQSPTTDFGDMQLIYAVTMTFCGVLILTAFAVTLATRFGQILTLLLCAAVYVLGLLADYYLGRPAAAGEAWFYKLAYAIVPNFQFFWVGDALTQEQIIPAAQVGQVAAYAGLYSLGVLGVGTALFETREVG